MINRQYSIDAEKRQGKVLLILGARRVGKTTLLKSFLSQTNLKYKFVQGEDIFETEVLTSRNLQNLNSFVNGYDVLVIDEAQYINEIGLNLKMIVDANPDIYVIATGSSGFELQNRMGAPLVGRLRKLLLYGFSMAELQQKFNEFELKQNLENFMIFGMYPEIILSENKAEKVEHLTDLINSYLFKDIFVFEKIRKSSFLLNLTRLLAFQIGNLVSVNELAGKLSVNQRTVERYIDLLEKNFIIFRLYPLSKNPRKEINRKFKVYFYDTGIRNAVINLFMPLEARTDTGQLWENFIISELIKKQFYEKQIVFNFYWRNYNNAEIDFIEEREGNYYAFEIKYSKRNARISKDFIENYKPTQIYTINKDNFLEFLL